LCGVHRRLFVPHQDMAQAGLLVQSVVQRQCGATWVAKQSIHTALNQCVEQGLRAIGRTGFGIRLMGEALGFVWVIHAIIFSRKWQNNFLFFR